MEEKQPNPEKPREGTEELLSKLSKKIEDGEHTKLTEYATEEGLRYERMLRAQLLLEHAIDLGVLFDEENWKEFSQLALDDKKLSEVLGDMKWYIDNRPCSHHQGPEE